MRKLILVILSLLLVNVFESRKYTKLNLGEYTGVSVHDDENNPLFGIVLHPEMSFA